MVRYKDEYGVTRRKSFSSKKKKTLQAKITEYVANFQEQVANSDESRKPLKASMKNWLRVYKFSEVERTTYDRYECTAEHQIYPYISNKPVGDVTPADIKKLLTKHMNAGYAFTTSKKVCPPRKNRQKTQAKSRMKRMTNMIQSCSARAHLFHGSLDNEPLKV
jgi:hypothetical protein